MGLTNKLVTKMRIATKSAPIVTPRPWEDAGTFAVDAVIRATACVGAQSGRTSTGHLGSSLFGSSDSDGDASTIWFERVSRDVWTIALGQPSHTGAVDWQLRFAVDPNTSTVEVTTPLRIERDGTLVNKKAHAQLRDLALDALTTGRAPSGGVEAEVAGSGRRNLPSMRPHAFLADAQRVQATVRTSLSGADLDQALDLVAFPCLDRSAGRRVYALGPAATAADDATAVVAAVDGGVMVSTDLATEVASIGDSLLLGRALALRFSVRNALAVYDSQAAIEHEDVRS